MHCGLLCLCPPRGGAQGLVLQARMDKPQWGCTQRPQPRHRIAGCIPSPLHLPAPSRFARWAQPVPTSSHISNCAAAFDTSWDLSAYPAEVLRGPTDATTIHSFRKAAQQCNSSNLHHSAGGNRIGSSRTDMQHACSMLAYDAPFTCCKALVSHTRATWRRLHTQWKMDEMYTMYVM